MAFNPSARRTDFDRAPQNDSWKAQGFLNLFMNRVNGMSWKVGFLALKESDAIGKVLLDMLDADASKASVILASMDIEYRRVGVEQGTGLAIFGGKVSSQRKATEDDDRVRGYLNFYLHTQDDTRERVGTIPLKDSDVFAAQLADALDKDPTVVASIKENFVINYRSATKAVRTKAPALKLVE